MMRVLQYTLMRVGISNFIIRVLLTLGYKANFKRLMNVHVTE